MSASDDAIQLGEATRARGSDRELRMRFARRALSLQPAPADGSRGTRERMRTNRRRVSKDGRRIESRRTNKPGGTRRRDGGDGATQRRTLKRRVTQMRERR